MKNQPDIYKDLAELGVLEEASEAGLKPLTPLCKAFDAIITNDPTTIAAKNKAMKLAMCNLPVLIVGETGTGKELFARLLHGNRLGKMICINCGGIPDTLIESEFFGHERGAFTGAIIAKPGYFESAINGTIFLDEIAELDRSLQSKLLRVLQEKKVRRLGSNDEININCRIVSATNHPVEILKTDNKLFRQDLFYRLAGSIINLTSLMQREDDIYLIAHEYGLDRNLINGKLLDPNGRKMAGNIRELLNWIEEYKALNRG